MTNRALLDQVAAQLEAVARRLRAGEAVGVPGDLSAKWIYDEPVDGLTDAMSAASAAAQADRAIGDAKDEVDDSWAEDMHEIGWGLIVWVERAQAVDVRKAVCGECEGSGAYSDGDKCEDCGGSGEGHPDFDYLCNYALRPIPPDAVLYQHREGPDTIEAEKETP